MHVHKLSSDWDGKICCMVISDFLFVHFGMLLIGFLLLLLLLFLLGHFLSLVT